MICLLEGSRSLEWVWWHNAWGCVWNRKYNPEATRPRYLMYCSHESKYIVTTKPDRLVLITIITRNFSFQPVNVGILHAKGRYSAWSKSCFMCHMVPLNNWNCHFTIPIVKEDCAHDTLPHGFNISMFKCIKCNQTYLQQVWDLNWQLLDSNNWCNLP